MDVAVGPVRRAAAADLEEIHALNVDALPEAWSLKSLRSAAAAGFDIFVCRAADDALAGYVMSRDVLDETHLLQIVVAPPFRRRGLASELTRHLIRCKHETGRTDHILLEVRCSNTAARHLYASLGFAVVGRRRNYYAATARAPAEDALLMTLPLH